MPSYQLIIGVAALAFGVATIYLRIQHPEKLWKLEPMKRAWGEKKGRAIHVLSYTVLPLVVGSVLLAQSAGLSLPTLPDFGTQREFNEILVVFRSGDLDTSRTRLESFLVKHPEHENALIILGHVHFDQQQWKAAEQAYTKALKVTDDKSFRAHNSLGILYEEGFNQLERAEAHYTKCIELNPKYSFAYSGLAVVKLKRNQDPAALKLAQQAHELNERDAVIASNLAIAYHYNQRLAERDKMAQRAQELGYTRMKSLKKIFAGELSLR